MIARLYVILCFSFYIKHLECASVDENSFQCSLKRKAGSSENFGFCRIEYAAEGCHEPLIPQAVARAGANVSIRTKKANGSSSYVAIRIPLSKPHLPVVISISGKDQSGSDRCVTIRVRSHSEPPSDAQLYISELQLPTGHFHLTGYYDLPSKHNPIFLYKELPLNHNRSRRSYPCRKLKCSLHKPEFLSDGGVFRFHYALEEDPVCENEDDNKVILYKLDDVTEQQCKSFNQNKTEPSIYMKKVRSSHPQPYDQETIEFRNMEQGCYTIRARPACFLPYQWFNSTNIVDMRAWNTSILLVPREREKSLQVTWVVGGYPHNFTHWQLKLWSLEDTPINCNGGNERKYINIFPSQLINGTNTYSYFDLTDGHYCVRLTALDPRCPDNECGVRASKSVYFNASRIMTSSPDPIRYDLPIIILVVVSVFIGVGFALFFYRCNPVKGNRTITYVNGSQKSKNIGLVKVLLIWTRYTPTNTPHIDDVIVALKEILTRYSGCEVMDYLDAQQLSDEECRLLMSDSTEWLTSKLKQTEIKVVFVVTDGAIERQKFHNNTNEKEPLLSEITNGFDANLFPYVMHFIKESFSLASDYSRIFPVCLPDLFETATGLDGLVPNVRYNIPAHLKDLTLRLHGISNDSRCHFPEPTHQQMGRLTKALADASETVLIRNGAAKPL